MLTYVSNYKIFAVKFRIPISALLSSVLFNLS